MKKVVLFASGNGTNVEQIANYFSNNENVEISLLLCNKEDAFVLERAKTLGIPSLLINRQSFYHSDDVLDVLTLINPDLLVLAGFLWLIPQNLTANFSHKIINIHPALLPKYGGKGMYGHHVHDAVVANKESQTGITIHYVNEQYDKGDIIFQATCPVSPADTSDDVAAKIHLLEKEHFPKVIAQLLGV